MYEAMQCKYHVCACDYELTGEYIETDQIVKDLVTRRLAGEDPRELAYRFHKLLGEAAAEFASANAGTVRTAALSGGCYQNTLLLDITKKALTNRGFKVLTHGLIPPNDGGISIGQAFYGMNKLKNGGI
jgi:hydrogenase maturation protein HypF